MTTSLSTKVPIVVPSISPSYVPSFLHESSKREACWLVSDQLFLSLFLNTSSPSASVNNAYEEKSLTSGGVYDPSSCSSSKQPVIIGGSGNFVSLEETQKKSVLFTLRVLNVLKYRIIIVRNKIRFYSCE
jgi:hypothetical protein